MASFGWAVVPEVVHRIATSSPPRRVHEAVVELRLRGVAHAAPRDEVLDGHQARIVVFAHAPRVGIQDMPDGRDALAEVQQLVHLLLVLGEDHLGLPVIEEIMDLLAERVAVEAEGQGADRVRRDLSADPVRPVVSDERHHVAPAQAEIVEAQRESLHPLVVVAPRERSPETEILLAQGDVGGMLARIQAQELRERVGGLDPLREIDRHAPVSARAALRFGPEPALPHRDRPS